MGTQGFDVHVKRLEMRTFFLICGVLLTLITSTASVPANTSIETQLSGSWSGNGGGSSLTKDNVWYLGPQTVEYCFDIDQSFPLGPTHVKAIIDEAISDWLQFFKSHHLDQINFESDTMTFPDQKSRRISNVVCAH